MALVHLNVRGWLKLLCALVFVFGVVVPCLLLMTAGSLDPAQSILQRESLSPRRHDRKPLDYTGGRESAEALRFQISELEAIRVSVRNELREMDKDRQKLFDEVESGREALAGVKKDIEKAKNELQNTKSKLSRATRQVKKASDAPPSISTPPQIVVVNIPSNLHNTPEGDVNSQAGAKQQAHCVRETCLDFSKCPLHRPFLVYVYNKHRRYSNLFPLRERRVVDDLVSSLEEVESLTTDPTRACLLVAIVGPLTQPLLKNDLEERVHSLPQWNGGANHILIELPLDGSDSLLRDIDTGRALVAHGVTANSHHQTHSSILLPPLTIFDQDKPLWQGLARHLPARRQLLIYFEGQQSQGKSPLVASSDLDTIAGALSDRIKDELFIKTSCSLLAAESERVFPGEWSLCGSAEQRRSHLIHATFSLVLGNGGRGLSGPQTYTRLMEALRYGAVPVIVGVGQLPLDTVIDWKLAAVVIPSPQLGQIHLYLKSLTDDSILSFRRQGWFLWETYFSSPHRVLNSVISIVRYWLHHPPPVARDQDAVTRLVSIPGGGNRRVPSPKFQHNLTVYTSELWNSPPGPFYMYPSTPFQPTPISGSQYVGLSEEQLLHLPQHVVEAGGITGPYFEDYLLGNTPEEQFTVVMLTYERNEVLLLSLERLSDLDGLSKVVVVWNNPSPPPSSMRWPDIGVPLEVVSVGRNSLNNRFLPFSLIETDAVLSIDDDIHLRHDEIQFAFRVWREARERVVGFPGRFHAYDVRYPGNWLYNSNYSCELSMVLTGAAFIHKYYLYLYSQWLPQEIRDTVDKFMNCEDIAMNFLVSHITRRPPLKVTSRWTFRCPGCPDTLSTNDEHFNERHICMNKFTEVLGYMPLLYTQFRVDSVLFKTRLPTHLEKCYQYI